jgi:hypothetical protein
MVVAVSLLMAMAIPAAAGGPADKATGSVYWENRTGVEFYAEFDAHEGLDGRPAKGYLLQERVDGLGGFTVAVTDVVVGERLGKKFACFGGFTEDAWGVLSFAQGLYRWTIVVDGGEPGVGVDGIKGNFLLGPPLPGPCISGSAARWYSTGGNVQVHFGGSGV